MTNPQNQNGIHMSYDISLLDPVTGLVLQSNEPHFMRGGTYCMCGTTDMWLNITYNYARHYDRVMDKGVRSIYGKSGAESIPILQAAIEKLGTDVDEDYWKSTEGNARRALVQLLALAQMRPDGVWGGD